MGHYQQLTREQRYGIYTLLKTGHNQSKIAAGIGVHKSTISRELRRNPAAPPQGGTGPAGSGDGGGTRACGAIVTNRPMIWLPPATGESGPKPDR